MSVRVENSTFELSYRELINESHFSIHFLQSRQKNTRSDLRQGKRKSAYDESESVIYSKHQLKVLDNYQNQTRIVSGNQFLIDFLISSALRFFSKTN